MRTITTKVYEYSELSEQAKERARDIFREDNDFAFLGDDLSYKLQELLQEYNIKYDKFVLPLIFYSLSYSQGDGAMFEGTVFYENYTVNIKQSGHYYHAYSKELDIYGTNTNKQAKAKVYADFNDIYIDICKQLEQYGYEVMEYEQSDEYLDEMLDGNGYEFTENGGLL